MSRAIAENLLLGEQTIPGLLARARAARGEDVFLRFGDRTVTIADLGDDVARAVGFLRSRGVTRGSRVGVMLTNHPDLVALILALISMRAVWVPLNPRLRGDPLTHQCELARPELVLVGVERRDVLAAASDRPAEVWSGGDLAAHEPVDLNEVLASPSGADDVVSLMFTSGTTGPAKAVQVTDRMLRVSALGALLTSGAGAGDVLLLWEPLCHIGGAQVLFVPLVESVQIALLPRFSGSAFWAQAGTFDATHVHHLGGILSMLLAAPATPAEHAHRVRVSWGGGMDSATWRAVEQRFGVQVRECYGMTEACSIATVNVSGPGEGVGRPLPYFDVEIHDEAGRPLTENERGQIVIRPRQPGLITPGYLDNPKATAAAWHDGAWHTGDSGFRRDGSVHFTGRLTDSVRHRGENVSAWEVESVTNQHPEVSESALIGVPADHGDQDLALFLTPAPGATPTPDSVLHWCREQLAPFQVPRFVIVIDSFARTPSERIIKRALLDRTEPWYDAAGWADARSD